MEAFLDIKQWGNSLGVRLPAVVAKAAHLSLNQRVRIQVEGERVIIEADTSTALSLQERLVKFDPQRHGGESMATTALGAEQW
jgi:antitoxin MazE